MSVSNSKRTSELILESNPTGRPQERRALANRLESQASRAAQLLESLRRALSEKALANKTDGQEGKAGAGLGGESEEGKEGGESKGGGKGQEGGQPGGL